jgi:hypothetical protein
MTESVMLNRPHALEQPSVVGHPIASEVNSSVARRTQRDHEARIVWSPVAEPSDVVRLQIRHAIRSDKGSRLLASFAVAVGARHHVVPHVSAPLHNCDLRAAPAGLHLGCRECSASERREINFLIDGELIDSFADSFKVAKLKNDRLSCRAFSIGRGLAMKAGTNERALKAQSRLHLGEQQQIPSISRVVRDRSVAAKQLHVSYLTFAEVFEGAVGQPSIRVTMRQSLFTRDDDHKWEASRGYNPALLLPAEPRVDVAASVVDATSFKSPRHSYLPRP